MYDWNELIKFAQKDEVWDSADDVHIAVLVARQMHAERLAAIQSAQTAPFDGGTSVSSGPTDLAE